LQRKIDVRETGSNVNIATQAAVRAEYRSWKRAGGENTLNELAVVGVADLQPEGGRVRPVIVGAIGVPVAPLARIGELKLLPQ
jgi:hypothetical protein